MPPRESGCERTHGMNMENAQQCTPERLQLHPQRSVLAMAVIWYVWYDMIEWRTVWGLYGAFGTTGFRGTDAV